jgi:hypothetical protein
MSGSAISAISAVKDLGSEENGKAQAVNLWRDSESAKSA